MENLNTKRMILAHLPPLDVQAFSKRPKIVQKSARTKARPTKEEKHYRHVSDGIANNYTPTASQLTTSLIYKSNSLYHNYK